MTKRPTQSKPAAADADNTSPAFNTPAWHTAWKARGWEAPPTPPPANPYEDQQLYLYAATLRSKFGFVRFVGLPTQGGPEDTPIQELFVEPALSSQRIDPASDPKQWPATTPLIDAVLAHPRLVALGDPGSGKSTLISWIVYNLLSRESNPLKAALGALVPITLVLRDLELPAKPTWQQVLEAFVKHPAGQALGSVDRINQLLHAGHAIVLIDGLDEAGGIETRRDLVVAIHQSLRDYVHARVIVTSRFVGYDDAPLELSTLVDAAARKAVKATVLGGASLAHVLGNQLATDAAAKKYNLEALVSPEHAWAITADDSPTPTDQLRRLMTLGKVVDRLGDPATRLYVCPFDDPRIALFVRNWHERHETDRSSRNHRVTDLLAALDRTQGVKPLARIPNMLTLIALVYRVYVKLPDGRAELYERIAQAYLESIDIARKLPTLGHPLTDMKRWLGYVAFQMQRLRFAPTAKKDATDASNGKADADGGKDNGILVSRQQLLAWIGFAMQHGGSSRIADVDGSAAAFVDWIARRAGLILPRSEDLFAFTHLSFQEYFAAWFLHEQVMDPGWLSGDENTGALTAGTEKKTLQAATVDIRWQETFILMFELLGNKGRWSDHVFKALFDGSLSENAERHDAAFNYNDRTTQREYLMVCIARDRHSGVSQGLADRTYAVAWTLVDAANRQMRDTGLWPQFKLTGALFGRDGPTIPAPLQVLRSNCAARVPNCLAFWGTATDDTLALLTGEDPNFGHVTELRLWDSQITDLGIGALAAKHSPLSGLLKLSLGGTQITDQGVAVLAAKDSSLTSLKVLDVGNTGISDQALAYLSAKDSPLTSLTALYLYETRITDRGLTHLAAKDSPLSALTSLSLNDTKITDQGLATLAAKDSPLTALNELDLSYTEITNQGLAVLAAKDSSLTALNNLDVSGTQITDQGLAALAAEDSPLAALTKLNLYNTKITDQGVAALQRRFPAITIYHSMP